MSAALCFSLAQYSSSLLFARQGASLSFRDTWFVCRPVTHSSWSTCTVLLLMWAADTWPGQLPGQIRGVMIQGDGDNDEGVLVTIWILHKKKKSVITIIYYQTYQPYMCVSYEYEVSQIIFPRYLNSAPMSSSAWCRTDCHCRIHSFIFGLHFTCTQGHGGAAASPCCLGVKAGFRSGRVTSSSQVQHSETNTIKLTMFSLGGSSANTAVYVLVASCLNSPIESWSWSLVFYVEIQFPWQQPSISLLSK